VVFSLKKAVEPQISQINTDYQGIAEFLALTRWVSLIRVFHGSSLLWVDKKGWTADTAAQRALFWREAFRATKRTVAEGSVNSLGWG
jgi:hypothetical protein